MVPLLAAALFLSPGAASLRWEQPAVVEAPLQAALELAFDDPSPCYGPEVRGEDGRDRILESRLAFAQPLPGLRVSANATLSTNLRSGVEWFGGIGDPHAFVEPPLQASLPRAFDLLVVRARVDRPGAGGERRVLRQRQPGPRPSRLRVLGATAVSQPRRARGLASTWS